MRIRPSLAAVAATAVLATACGGNVEAPLATNVPTAILTSLSAPVRIEVHVDAALDLAELSALLLSVEELGADSELEQDEYTLETLALMKALSLEVTRGADQTSGMALLVNGTPAVEVRQDAGALSGMSLPQMLEAEPAQTTVLGHLDEAAIREYAAILDEPIGDESFTAMIDSFIAAAPTEVPDDVTDLLHAGARGEWVGLTGLLDLGAIADDLGMSSELMQAVVPIGMDMPTTQDVARLITDAVTFTRLDDVDSQAAYSGALDTDTFLRGGAGIYAQMDATGQLGGMLSGMIDGLELVPVPDALTVTFAGDNLASLSINGAKLLAEFIINREHLSPTAADEFRTKVDGLVNSHLDIVFTFSDHNDVGNVLDGVDATTMSWDRVGELAAEYGGPFGGGPGVTNGLEELSLTNGQDNARAASLLRNGAVEMETWFTDFQTYTDDVADLEAQGLVIADDEYLGIVFATDVDYCLEAYAGTSDVWSYSPATGVVQAPCS